MDLIDRYVFDVQRYLPPGQRDPVGTALADELRTLVRDSETHSGRRMTEDELAALIRMRGHPYLLAQPYRAGRYLLIGPSLLPQYWQALKTALTIAFVAFVVVAAVFAVNGTDPIQLLRYLGSFWKIAVNIFLAVTIAFAIFDAVQARVLLKQPWDPRTLPAPTAVPGPATPTGSLADIATSGVLLLWWLAIPHYPWVLLGPVARFFTFTNEWRTAYLPVSVCFAAALAVHVIRPYDRAGAGSRGGASYWQTPPVWPEPACSSAPGIYWRRRTHRGWTRVRCRSCMPPCTGPSPAR